MTIIEVEVTQPGTKPTKKNSCTVEVYAETWDEAVAKVDLMFQAGELAPEIPPSCGIVELNEGTHYGEF